jgi:hypothetical protein
VNGADSPERVPDELAYIHFISSISIKADAPESEVRRRMMLAEAGLADYDVEAVVKAVEGVRKQLTQLDDERRQITVEALQRFEGHALAASLRTRRESVLMDARNRVLAA